MAVERKDIEQELADSLKELVLRVPFEKITIKQITDGAGVIRVTFYNHFQDKYDLLGWIIRSEILAPVRILLLNNMYREVIDLIFTGLTAGQGLLYRGVASLSGSRIPFEEIVRGVYPQAAAEPFHRPRKAGGSTTRGYPGSRFLPGPILRAVHELYRATAGSDSGCQWGLRRWGRSTRRAAHIHGGNAAGALRTAGGSNCFRVIRKDTTPRACLCEDRQTLPVVYWVPQVLRIEYFRSAVFFIIYHGKSK